MKFANCRIVLPINFVHIYQYSMPCLDWSISVFCHKLSAFPQPTVQQKRVATKLLKKTTIDIVSVKNKSNQFILSTILNYF